MSALAVPQLWRPPSLWRPRMPRLPRVTEAFQHLRRGSSGHLKRSAAGHLVHSCGAPTRCTWCQTDTTPQVMTVTTSGYTACSACFVRPFNSFFDEKVTGSINGTFDLTIVPPAEWHGTYPQITFDRYCQWQTHIPAGIGATWTTYDTNFGACNSVLATYTDAWLMAVVYKDDNRTPPYRIGFFIELNGVSIFGAPVTRTIFPGDAPFTSSLSLMDCDSLSWTADVINDPKCTCTVGPHFCGGGITFVPGA